MVRALGLLEVIGASPDGVRLSDAAEAMGLFRSTAHNLLATLESCGYLTQHSHGGRYFVTERVAEIARGAVGNDEALRAQVRPVLEELSSLSGETCYLAAPALRDYVYLDAVESSQPLKLAVPVGGREPFFDTAIGHVLLAFCTGAAQAAHKESPAKWEQWQDQVEIIRERQYALDLENFQPGLCCVAVPVRRQGRVQAALGISGPAARLPRQRLNDLATTALRVLAGAGL
ncbi:IclR family transcriptional regulator [Streptomyces sp. NPDC003077]|uniref:IclR family transcriptional regulator n=1 Tax=Streptomyces sp. NPDC003077 TaxID=3154443 RepID=UPI0033A90016